MEKRIDKILFIVVGTFFFGYLGVDRFMRGQIVLGILKICDITGTWALIDFIISLVKLGKYEKEFVFVDGKWRN